MFSDQQPRGCRWFPEHERAQATAVYTVGEYLGLACFGPVLFWISRRFGWRSLFCVVGAAGIVFAGIWWTLYREPEAAGRRRRAGRRTNALEQVRRLLGYRQVWGASIGQFGGNSTLVFFLTWFPTYLARERHMDWIRAGFFRYCHSWPRLAAFCWADGDPTVAQRTGSRNLARKLPIIAGLFGASTIILANYVSGDSLVIAILSFAFFCQGMTGLGWTVISDIAPIEMVGLTGGSSVSPPTSPG